MRKTNLGVVLAGILTLSLLAACGNKEAVEVPEVSLTVSSQESSVEVSVSASVEDEALSISVEEPSKEDATKEETEKTVEEPAENTDQKEKSLLESTGDLMVPSNSGRLHVDGIEIKNEKNETVQLKGLSTHGLAWFPQYVNKSLFKEFRTEWNCNVIRLAMYTEEYGGYVSGGNQDDLKDLIDDGVSFATENDMYVIVDWHILSDGNPNKNKEASKEFFEEVSDLYKDHNNVIYEICNEPNGGVKWDEIKSYAEEIIPVIRKNDKNAIILVGTPNWSQFVDKAAKDPITGYDNIMYTLHFYADTHKKDLRNTMKNALEDGLPIFISEYGICDASGNGSINEKEAEKWMKLMNEYKISSCAWNISNKAETSAIFGSWTSKTHGFMDDDLSASGKWVYSMLTGKEKYEASPDREVFEDDEDEDEDGIDNEAIKIEQGDLVCYLKETNSWGSEEGTCHQYELTIVNNGKDVSSWSVDISFDSDVTLKDGWCGVYKTSQKTLTISNESYNGEIKKGNATRDIGFIVIY